MASSSPDPHAATRRFVDRWCDHLNAADVDWTAASDPTKRYNCFGFVVGDLRWWQAPLFIDGLRAFPTHYWPEAIAEDGSVEAYMAAAETLGFRASADAAWDADCESIVLYFKERDRQFTHAARETSPGVWASKLGSLSDIAHPVDGVDCITYGTGRVHMRRRRPMTGE